MRRTSARVVVLGGGAAGLMATHRLQRAKVDVLLVEARARLGGRIETWHQPFAEVPVELGAEFVHGRAPVLVRLAKKAKAALREQQGMQLVWRDGVLEKADRTWERVFRGLSRPGEGDRSVVQFAAEMQAQGRWGAEEAALAIGFVEGYEAADAERASIQAMADEERAGAEIESDRAFRIEGGYDRIVEAIARPLIEAGCVRRSTRVEQVRWRRGEVELVVRGPSGKLLPPITATHLVVTLPLGVWQANEVRFSPPLRDKLRAAKRLGVGAVVKCLVRFREPFWETGALRSPTPPRRLRTFSFLHARPQPIPTWWTLNPFEAPVLVGWAAGPKGHALSAASDEEVADRGIASLSTAFGVDRQELESLVDGVLVRNWQSDPFARGAYSWVPLDGRDAPAQLARPVEDTLFFAGEHTNDEGHRGTVHGALETGERAAREVLRALGR